MNEFDDREIWVVIGAMAKLLTCNSTGRTAFWETQEEASQYVASNLGSGYECEYYIDEDNQDKLIPAAEAKNISIYG